MSTISGVDPVQDALGRTDNAFSSMSSEDFIRIMFTELSNQDPFQPNDSGALLEQMNSIRSIESDINLVDQLKSLVFENQLASAANLVGRTITGLTTTNDRVTGEVIAARREGDTVTLELASGHSVRLDAVESIESTSG
ncbi:MAG: flagellar hook capping FlgD N-terminal domain-containing protein [Planctomycetota bacterium]|jgi:flagellar basal-body rod modification protein FlgD